MRASGILMHITSLPSPYGIGTMGKEAYDFVDFLKKAGQKYWQILPLSPTGYGNSPYQGISTFAGNPYLIDLEALIKGGLLEKEEAEAVEWSEEPDRVDFGILYNNRFLMLRKAYERFTDWEALDAFVEAQSDWLPDYALFMAIKDSRNGADWNTWPDGLRLRQPEALDEARETLAEEIRFQYFMQYLFSSQWTKLRAYAAENGISIIGDVPIYVPLDSADVWSAPQQFQLDADRHPELVAGVPPDYFTADGQLWGNPLYNWDYMKETGYAWWLKRLSAAAKLFDIVRLDHFRGFESYWAVPAGDKTARGGHWVKGPGLDFITCLKENLPELHFIAEDLGYLTKEVLALRDASGYPGMKVLEFAFDSREPSDYLPHTYTPNSVCYTGTHDNLTMQQWFDEADEEAIAYAKEYMGLNEEEGYVYGMIRGGMSSVSSLFVVQIQDYLTLGARSRMNFPGTLTNNNWTWRAERGMIDDRLAQRIYKITKLYGRL